MKPPSKVVKQIVGQRVDIDVEVGTASGQSRTKQVDERGSPGQLRLGDQAVDVGPAELPFGQRGDVAAMWGVAEWRRRPPAT
jgi:hypothetical protein